MSLYVYIILQTVYSEMCSHLKMEAFKEHRHTSVVMLNHWHTIRLMKTLETAEGSKWRNSVFLRSRKRHTKNTS